jgi:hypothetical protein
VKKGDFQLDPFFRIPWVELPFIRGLVFTCS